MRTPDFFVVGASKCGTTALCEYLAANPHVCFARTKEPHFYSDDFPGQKADDDFATYWRRNFSFFDPARHVAVGDGSGTYYISSVAIANILAANPAARFVYMVRDPVDMMASWHQHVQFGIGEPATLEELWETRKPVIREIDFRPELKTREHFWQYRALASLGTRLEEMKMLIPAKQLMVIVFDDFIRDPKSAYEKVLAFIGVPSDARTAFPQVNQARAQRSYTLGRLNTAMPRWLINAVREFKHLVGLTHVSMNILVKLNAKKIERPPLTQAFRQKLVVEFASEVSLLETHLGRDLSAWRR
jgi:hypothetical protein